MPPLRTASAELLRGASMGQRAATPIYERLLRPLLFRLEPENAHRLAQFALGREFPWSLFATATGRQPAESQGRRLGIGDADRSCRRFRQERRCGSRAAATGFRLRDR